MVRDELKSKAFPLRPEFVQSRTSRTEKVFLGFFWWWGVGDSMPKTQIMPLRQLEQQLSGAGCGC